MGVKDLREKRKQLVEALNSERRKLTKCKELYNNRLSQLSEMDKAISECIGELVVSDHAVIRYLERVYELNLKEIKEEILHPSTIEKIKAIGNGRYPLKNGGIAVVQDNTVVTIVD